MSNPASKSETLGSLWKAEHSRLGTVAFRFSVPRTQAAFLCENATFSSDQTMQGGGPWTKSKGFDMNVKELEQPMPIRRESGYCPRLDGAFQLASGVLDIHRSKGFPPAEGVVECDGS